MSHPSWIDAFLLQNNWSQDLKYVSLSVYQCDPEYEYAVFLVKGARHFDFVPQSYVLPTEYQDFCSKWPFIFLLPLLILSIQSAKEKNYAIEKVLSKLVDHQFKCSHIQLRESKSISIICKKILEVKVVVYYLVPILIYF